MSYWISLNHPETKKMAEVESFEEGGNYCVGGSNEADLNVTYNYSKHFNFRELHEKKASTTIKSMEKAIKKLGIKRDENYWNATEGNVGYAIKILLNWAKQFPDYVWNVN